MKQIMAVEEARKLLGKDGENLTDEQIENMISLLDVIARDAIKQAQEYRKLERKELLELASFLYSRYLFKKVKTARQ